ncbi:MAG: VWA domain-containing protein [Thermaerobacter sp.]
MHRGVDLGSRWEALERFTPAMLRRLQRREGLLLGESGVLSTCVHVLTARSPGTVTVLTDADAGRTFYHRSRAGEILHLDVFHQVGDVDHRRVAARLRSALAEYTRRAWGINTGLGTLADYVDIQTATGGGRITGSLTFGRKLTLQRAHRNHVHVAMLMAPADLVVVFAVLAAVEQAILECGLELRRVDAVVHQQGGTQPLPLSDYSSETDSYLRDPRDRRGRTGGGPGSGSSGAAGDEPGGRGSGSGGRGGHGDGGAVDGGDGGAGGGTGGSGSPQTGTAWLPDAAELQAAALSLARRIGSEEHLRALMELLARGLSLREVLQELSRRGVEPETAESLLGELRRGDFAGERDGALRLTPRGWHLAEYISRHRRDLRLALRKAMRRTVQRDAAAVGRGLARGRYDPLGKGRTRRAGPPEAGVPLQDVAWPESVTAAAARQAAAWRNAPRTGPAGGPGGENARGSARRPRLTLQYDDLRVLRRRRRRPVDVCLLIDASASMAGERMRAAKTLARHLLATTRDRVAVVVFQERQVRVSVPFTRNDLRVEQGLATIRPYGLTPLATGLAAAREYLKAARPRNPLLILITDGIPTVPHDGTNPLDDALSQAARWRGSRVSFTCVGLQPNERYLRGLVEAAGGSLHIVDELEADTLVAIATAERNRRARPHRS